MAAVLVVLLSLVVGAVAYVATIRSGRRVPAAIGFEGSSSTTTVAPRTGSRAEDEARGPGETPPPVAPPPPSPASATSPGPTLPDPGYAYLRVTTESPSWRDRIAGLAGIAVLLVIGAGAIAFGIYQFGSVINALVRRFLEG